MKNQKFKQLINTLAALSGCILLIVGTLSPSLPSNENVTASVESELSDDAAYSNISCMLLNNNKPLGEEDE